MSESNESLRRRAEKGRERVNILIDPDDVLRLLDENERLKDKEVAAPNPQNERSEG